MLATLKLWVEQNFEERAGARDMQSRLHRAEIRLREVNGLIQESEKRWTAARRILEAAGIDVPKDYGLSDDDLEGLPF